MPPRLGGAEDGQRISTSWQAARGDQHRARGWALTAREIIPCRRETVPEGAGNMKKQQKCPVVDVIERIATYRQEDALLRRRHAGSSKGPRRVLFC